MKQRGLDCLAWLLIVGGGILFSGATWYANHAGRGWGSQPKLALPLAVMVALIYASFAMAVAPDRTPVQRIWVGVGFFGAGAFVGFLMLVER